MSQPAKAQEPSMEEILASIRRIIADDDTGKAAKPVAVAHEPAPVASPPQGPASEAAPPPAPVVSPSEPPAATNRREVDAMLASLNAVSVEEAVKDDVLELTESMTAPAPGTEPVLPSFQTIDGQSDVVFADLPANPEPARAQVAAPPEPVTSTPTPSNQLPSEPSPLLSNATAAAVDSAFNSLAQTVLVQNARTLEDLVREMLRPLLKSWLDDNLPSIVERTVRTEIERVSRGRG